MTEIVKNPDLLGGISVFRGTRVPLKNLFDYLLNGSSINEFLDDFPTVSSSQVKKVLKEAEHQMESCLIGEKKFL